MAEIKMQEIKMSSMSDAVKLVIERNKEISELKRVIVDKDKVIATQEAKIKEYEALITKSGL